MLIYSTLEVRNRVWVTVDVVGERRSTDAINGRHRHRPSESSRESENQAIGRTTIYSNTSH